MIRLTSLGDVTLATGIVREVKLALETAELTVITNSRYEDIFRFNPHLDELLLLEGKSFEDMSRLIQEVRARKLDVLADLQLNPRSLLISAASGAKSKLRYSKSRWVRGMMVRKRERKACDHVTSRYFRPFEQLGLRSGNLKPQIWIDSATRKSVDSLLPAGDNQMVAISPGARRLTATRNEL